MAVRSKAKITSKGQITLPRPVRDALNVHQGDAVIFEVAEQGVSLLPERSSDRFLPYAGKYRIGKGKSVSQTDEWLRELRGGGD